MVDSTTPDADPLRQLQKRAIRKVQQDDSFWQPLNSGGIPWGVLIGLLTESPHRRSGIKAKGP
jgi:hypothetical protein